MDTLAETRHTTHRTYSNPINTIISNNCVICRSQNNQSIQGYCSYPSQQPMIQNNWQPSYQPNNLIGHLKRTAKQILTVCKNIDSRGTPIYKKRIFLKCVD